MREVVAGAGAHEGCVGRIWDGGGTLRRGRACQRAKAEGGIDEKGVRVCGDGKKGDSKAEVGRGATVYSVWCHPHASPRPRKNMSGPKKKMLLNIEILDTMNVGGRTAGA